MGSLHPTLTGVVRVRNTESLVFGEWPGGGPPLVFAHGLTSTHRNIAAVAAHLDGAFRVVAPDLLGRGNSSKPPAGNYGMDGHGRDVIALMDALGIERAVVGGHSMGAYVATTVAVLAPERVMGLALIDGGVFLPPPPGTPEIDPDVVMDQLLKPVVDRMHKTYASVGEYVDEWRAMPYFGEDWGPAVEEYALYDLAPVGGGYASKCVEAAAREDFRDLLANRETPERLARVRCPVLGVGAEFGLTTDAPSVLSEAHAEHLRSIVADADYVAVPGTTHHTVTLSSRGAAATADALAKFVARVA